MKLQKKLFILAVLLMAASMVFAQTSMTSHSTQELFGTDVDDFMNVNEWQNVKPKNIFGFLGYGKNGTGKINLGLAHQFKPFYLGSYFEGQLNGWKNDKKASGDITSSIPAGTDLPSNGKVLFGFGNIGVMTDIYYKPDSDNQVKWTESSKTKQIDNKFDLNFNLMAGINLNSNNKLYKISAKLGLDSTVDKETTVIDGKTTNFTDNSSYTLNINAGFSHDFSSKDSLTQTVAADLETIWAIAPTKTSMTVLGSTTTTNYTYGGADNTITLTPKYQIAYEPEGKFAFKAEAGLKTNLNFEADSDYDLRVVNGVKQPKSYTTPRNHNQTLFLKPSLKAAFVYAPVSKFKLNFGLGFNVPSVTWAFTTTETRDVNSGKVSKTDKSNTFTFTTDDGKFTASSGFTWLITENVVFDANWNIINTLISSGFSTNFTGSNFWDNINRLVFHKIGFAVSVKF